MSNLKGDTHMTFVVSAGDYFVHPQVVRAGDHTWQRRYDVLAAEHGTRFGRADVLLNVFSLLLKL
jgi:hypothetical protein